ncbi:MAG: methyltransferase domain-containing protein [Candidatus Paceibacterota bacterium]
MQKNIIEKKPLPCCPACKAFGIEMYTNLTDDLSKTDGIWQMKKCSNSNCGTYWLDPTPDPDNLYLLYKDYTTHTDPLPIQNNNKRSGLKKLLDQTRQSILNQELGYPSPLSKVRKKLLNTISLIHPGWRNEQLNQVLYIPYVNNGHLLDVGCGSGAAMIDLQKMGWKVTGIDFDPNAIHNAKQKGLNVYLGDLKQINFPDNSFDAILMSHVIEHVPNPIETLKECHRILKHNGHLIAITPNADSRGHRRFKDHWRGLEVPRHLQIFTPNSLKNIGLKAGFRISEEKNCMQGIYYIWDASAAHEMTGTYELPPQNTKTKLMAKLRLFVAGIRMSISPNKEETAILHCQK